MIFRSARELWACYVIAEAAMNPTQSASPIMLPKAGENISKACSKINPLFLLLLQINQVCIEPQAVNHCNVR